MVGLDWAWPELYGMSEAPKSTWLVAKLLSPMTEEVTCQLMLSPNSVLDWPTHCWIATLAKLDPVDCSDGLAPASGTPQSWQSTAVTTAIVAATATAARRGRH